MTAASAQQERLEACLAAVQLSLDTELLGYFPLSQARVWSQQEGYRAAIAAIFAFLSSAPDVSRLAFCTDWADRPDELVRRMGSRMCYAMIPQAVKELRERYYSE